jgi:single-strand DNA-binding protein
VTVGAQGENAARFLSRGRPVGAGARHWVPGRTRGSGERQAVDISADQVQFLGTRSDGEPRPAAAAAAQ